MILLALCYLGNLDPCQIVTNLLKKLCCNELVAAKTMCKDDVTNTLLVPVNYMLDGSEVRAP